MHKVKWFQVLRCRSNNLTSVICLHIVKWRYIFCLSVKSLLVIKFLNELELIVFNTNVKYSLADNKIPRGSHKVMHRKRVTCELHDSYFRLMMIKPVTPKRAEVACSTGQLWEGIEWAKRRVHISAWEFDGNIRSTILNGRQ